MSILAAVNTSQRRHPYFIATLILVPISLVLFSRANTRLWAFYQFRAEKIIVLVLPITIAGVYAVALVSARYANFTPVLRISLRSSAIGLLVYLLAEPPDFTLANPAYVAAEHYVFWGYFAALGAAAMGTVVPSFAAPAAVYAISTRYLVASISGLVMSTLDIQYMVDMTLYLSTFGILAVQVGPKLHDYFADEARQTELAFVAFGLH